MKLEEICFKKTKPGTSLEVLWLGLHTSPVGEAGSISGQGTNIPQTLWHSQKIKDSL